LNVVVVGLGYVGLPVASVLAEEGFDVLGLEIDARRVAVINKGGNPIEGKEPGLSDLIQRVIDSGRLRAYRSVHADKVRVGAAAASCPLNPPSRLERCGTW
jgi:UDP-N-acetyl-D-mannosaminuronate dehydrogenase